MLISRIHVLRTTATYTEQDGDQRSALSPGSDTGRSVERVGHRVYIFFRYWVASTSHKSAVAMGTSPLFFITVRYLLVITRLLRRHVPSGRCLYYFTLHNFVLTINSKKTNKQKTTNQQTNNTTTLRIFIIYPHINYLRS